MKNSKVNFKGSDDYATHVIFSLNRSRYNQFGTHYALIFPGINIYTKGSTMMNCQLRRNVTIWYSPHTDAVLPWYKLASLGIEPNNARKGSDSLKIFSFAFSWVVNITYSVAVNYYFLQWESNYVVGSAKQITFPKCLLASHRPNETKNLIEEESQILFFCKSFH